MSPNGTDAGWCGSEIRSACAVIALVLQTVSISAADSWALREPVDSPVVTRVLARVRISGTFQTPTENGKTSSWPVRSSAEFSWDERRLEGAGGDAAAFRFIRDYQKADVSTKVGDHATSSRLHDNLRLLIAQGNPKHVEFYSPTRLMTRTDLDSLAMPADPLPIVALLPQNDVEQGEKWNPDQWVLQMLTGTEAVLKHEIRCELASVDAEVARISVEGHIEGATLGATSDVRISGHIEFNLTQKLVSKVSLRQTEKRSVGTVSPGIDVVATVEWQRAPVPSTEKVQINETLVDRLPVLAQPEMLRLSYQLPWNARFIHDRDWHLFHQTDQVAVFRLVRNGGLIAQCNVAEVPAARAGQHTSEEQFQADIRRVLGTKLSGIERAEQVTSPSGLYIYRVHGIGQVEQEKVHWIYYLCADRSGRQISFAFSVAEKEHETLNGADLDLVRSVEFTATGVPTRTARP